VNGDQSSEAFLFFPNANTPGVSDIYCGTGSGVIVRADETLTAFLELSQPFALVAIVLDQQVRFFQDSKPFVI